ncbi:GAF domain-containing sensor histidine kinase [Flexithrix dorotheae]|uniref:GAF domain-containing sensor histidine kinase n=1 Tax=Flexithrix dorotheae TaxID=70993 RepID=UPI00037DF91A|nr:GAF domain-containing sensor histidine kinase [Flexithrix dorotheae]
MSEDFYLRKYEELKQKENHFRILNNFATSLLYQSTVEEILWDVTKNAIAKLGFEDCVVYLLDENDEYLVQGAAHGSKNPSEKEIKDPIKIKLGEGIVGHVGKSGIPEIINDTSKDPRYIIDYAVRHSEIAVPIIAQNKVIGVIDSEHPEKNFYTEEHLDLLITIASMTSTKLSKANALMELERQNEKLKKINAELDRFVYSASHDLRAPLCSALGLIQVAMDEKDISNIKGYLSLQESSLKKLDNLIKDIANYSRNEKDRLKQEAVNFESIICSAIHYVKSIPCYNVFEIQPVIKLQLSSPFFSDEERISLILQHLLKNAIQFQDPQKPEKHVEVKVTQKDEAVELSVTDNGYGISPEHLNRIFDMFYIGTDRASGSGLGLYLVKEAVEKIKGKIEVKTEFGQGTTFTVHIPNTLNQAH